MKILLSRHWVPMAEERRSSSGAPPPKKPKTEVLSWNVQEGGQRSEDVVQRQGIFHPENLSMNRRSCKREREHYITVDLVPENQINIVKKKRRLTGVTIDREQGIDKESEDSSVDDQSILPAEIMSLILELLDLRNLKQLRLVCKSWLLQAQFHIQRRGVVRLHHDIHLGYSIYRFACVSGKKTQDLPQPFLSADVDFQGVVSPPAKLLRQLTELCPPLVITRFSSGAIPLHLVVPVVINSSSTLEYFQLQLPNYSNAWQVQVVMDPKLNLPKLRHLSVDASVQAETIIKDWIQLFPSIVAWIVKASPSLDTYEAKAQNNDVEFLSQLALQLDIKNVKTLILLGLRLNPVASEHFMSIPFKQLQRLKMSVVSVESPSPAGHQVLVATIKTCVNTLTTLDLSSVYLITATLDFPVFPHVQELSLLKFRDLGDSLGSHFPALKVLNVKVLEVDIDREGWNDFPPVSELRILRILHLKQFYYDQEAHASHGCIGFNIGSHDCRIPWENESFKFECDSGISEQLLKLLEKFPGLQRLSIPSNFLIRLCKLFRDPNNECSSLLQGLKHLELRGDGDYALLAVLRGIETITMIKYNDTIPVADFSSLKLFRFPWGNDSDLRKLMEIARGVEKIVVTNCCSFPRTTGDSRVKELLATFFETAPNAECGCMDWKSAQGLTKWY